MTAKKLNFLEGEALLFNKPYEWTSFQVVSKLRYILKYELGIKKIKVGHAGTLDPLATGLLILCTGKYTKRIDEFQAQEKEYTGTFELGATTPSFDKETEIDKNFPIDHITNELLLEATKQFTGDIIQTPPIYSAIKINGKRAYEYARNNKEVKIRPKNVQITTFELTKIELPRVHFRIVCSKGTYIRSLARDYGESLNSGAYLSSLTRTRIGDFLLEDAMEILDFKQELINK